MVFQANGTWVQSYEPYAPHILFSASLELLTYALGVTAGVPTHSVFHITTEPVHTTS